MDSPGEFADLLFYSNYAAAAGFLLLMLILTLWVLGFADSKSPLFKTIRIVCVVLLISPIAVRWYFSKYMVLWLACLIIAMGVSIKLRSRFVK